MARDMRHSAACLLLKFVCSLFYIEHRKYPLLRCLLYDGIGFVNQWITVDGLGEDVFAVVGGFPQGFCMSGEVAYGADKAVSIPAHMLKVRRICIAKLQIFADALNIPPVQFRGFLVHLTIFACGENGALRRRYLRSL